MKESNAAGRVRSRTRSDLRTAWIIAVLWNLVSTPLLFVLRNEIEQRPTAAIGFIFPVIGAGLLVRAMLLTLRWRRFGPSSFDIAVPASPGGVCGGALHTRLDSPQIGGERLSVTLKLTCLRREITGSGKNRKVREHILWRDEHDVPVESIAFTPVGASIPVHFAIPADALETTTTDESAGVFWSLVAEAPLFGVDLYEDFDVPVYRGSSSPAISSVPALAPTPRPTITRDSLRESGIIVRQTETGIEYHFTACRNLSVAIGFTVFLAIWTGTIWLLLALDVPWPFTAVFGLFELLFIAIAADLWLGTTTVTIGPGAIRSGRTVLGIGTTRVIPSGDITKVDLHIGVQSTGRAGTPYYQIRATRRNGRSETLARGIRSKAQAEWLADDMRSAIGLRT